MRTATIRKAASLTAERAVRYLRGRGPVVTSIELAREVLSASIPQEAAARRILETAFESDARLGYADGAWRLEGDRASSAAPAVGTRPGPEPDRAYVVVDGARPDPRRPFVMGSLTVVRARAGAVIAACAGDPGDLRGAAELRSAAIDALDGAVAVLHDPPGALASLEAWLEEPLGDLVSLRRLGRARAGMPANHDLGDLAARLRVSYREAADPARAAEIVEACLEALRRPGETLDDLRSASAEGRPRIPWQRYAFDRAWLRSVPSTPGTYRFFDASGALLYVGKARDLRRRMRSYFGESGERTPRVQRLLDALHKVEIAPTGSDLEAVLREATEIAERAPRANVRRRTHPTSGRGARFESILILEPAWPPHVLRAFLIHDGEWVDDVPIGPRGGGLRRVERLLEARCFDPRPGPVSRAPRPVDVELITRWLAAHRDRAVAFDPTHLRSAREVVERLRFFLGAGTLSEDGAGPWVPR